MNPQDIVKFNKKEISNNKANIDLLLNSEKTIRQIRKDIRQLEDYTETLLKENIEIIKNANTKQEIFFVIEERSCYANEVYKYGLFSTKEKAEKYYPYSDYSSDDRIFSVGTVFKNKIKDAIWLKLDKNLHPISNDTYDSWGY